MRRLRKPYSSNYFHIIATNARPKIREKAQTDLISIEIMQVYRLGRFELLSQDLLKSYDYLTGRLTIIVVHS
jgi:hypothetical protein